MTTPSIDQPSTAAQNIPQPTASVSQTEPGHDTLSSSAVEMKTLQSPAGAPETATTTGASGAPQLAPVDFTSVGEINPSESTQPAASSAAAPPARNELNRTETEAALGPSTDGPAANPDNSNGPTVVIMLLLTTGARHPYKIDEKYLKKRNVTVEEMDPYNISVYTLKELIWRDWREGTSCVVPMHLSFSSRARQLEYRMCFLCSLSHCHPIACAMALDQMIFCLHRIDVLGAYVLLHSHSRFTGSLYCIANPIWQNGNQGRPHPAR